MSPPQENAPNLVTLYDDFTHLQSLCTFFCDSVVALSITDLQMDRRSVNGLHICADQVKRHAEALRGRLRIICDVVE